MKEETRDYVSPNAKVVTLDPLAVVCNTSSDTEDLGEWN